MSAHEEGHDQDHTYARTAVGRLYDTFTLRKRAGQPNLLEEALPPAARRSAP